MGNFSNYKYFFKGIEKLNDITTQEFFMATNRNDNFLEQILKRRLRIDKYIINYSKDVDDLQKDELQDILNEEINVNQS
jgi:hypothetical protein